MTAVASPPSFQPLPRWGNGNSASGALETMSTEEVSRMFQPRKSIQRTNSSSTVVSSSSSNAPTAPAPSQVNGDAVAANGEASGWEPRKKPIKGLWPPSKAEPVSGLSNARSQPLPALLSGQSAASTMSAMHQPSSILPSQARLKAQTQQNGNRPGQPASQGEPQAILVLLPLTGTFERKHITVPYMPDVLRIGRQTNVKTVPTPVNGYFDSKVLSRQHAEVWATPEGKIMIRDVKSSNGTFVNGHRLSPENRESEPHPLHEGDMLELGIDIVSEDQKSIVHHKVSAKVELAGVYGSGTNILNLNFGDMESASGNGVGSNGQQLRGRGGSQGSIGPNGRTGGPLNVVGNNANMMGPQRQMNMWLNPITIEQVVKKLTTELKQAKQQSQDLHHTSNFFSTLLSLEPGQELPKPPADPKPVPEPHTNGILPRADVEPLSPFSQPPAPPPQQPLPEKPDIAAFIFPDAALSQSPLQRTDTERPFSGMNLPSKAEPQSSQILSLVEALNTAKREIDSQGDKVKHLEVLLNRERKARESAEEKARRLLEGHTPAKVNGHVMSTVDEDAFEPPSELSEDRDVGLTNGYHDPNDSEERLTDASSIVSSSTVKSPEELHSETKQVEASTSRLQERLDLMVREMDDMKVVMENYKRRAEDAEEERNTLRDMIEKIRATGASSNGKLVSKAKTSPEDDPSDEIINESESQALTSTERRISMSQPYARANGSASGPTTIIPDLKELERTVSSVLQQTQPRGQGAMVNGNLAMQSAPYVSMVGVVLLGVGIMTWLNGWQREKI